MLKSGQFAGGSSFLPLRGSQRLNSGHQVCGQESLSLIISLAHYIHLYGECVCVCVVSHSTCGSQRTICKSQFFPSLILVTETEVRSSGSLASTFTHRGISLAPLLFFKFRNSSLIYRSMEHGISIHLHNSHSGQVEPLKTKQNETLRAPT